MEIMQHLFILICLVGMVCSDTSTIGNSFSTEIFDDNELLAQNSTWSEWSAWSKWSGCSRSCGGGLSRQHRRCKKKPCKGKTGSTKYKICNSQPCHDLSDFRGEQCASFDNVPYSGQLLKWYPYYDSTRPCSLICRGIQTYRSLASSLSSLRPMQRLILIANETANKIDGGLTTGSLIDNNDEDLDSDETIVVQLAEKVIDGTKCNNDPDSFDVCIGGNCMKVGCDEKVGSNKTFDSCGICGGNSTSCQRKYAWTLATISACSKSCGGGMKMTMAICQSTHGEMVVEDVNCDAKEKPMETLLPCNTHDCETKWLTSEWGKCSATCGGGVKTRSVFCTEEYANKTTKLPDRRCIASRRPRNQKNCNIISCPMWETSEWSQCSATCGFATRTRTIECRDGEGRLSSDCDPTERPGNEQECKTSTCPGFSGDKFDSTIQSSESPPTPEKLIAEEMPSKPTFIVDNWSTCSATCGEGIRHRDVHCKIFLEFSRTMAKLPDHQCTGTKPQATERCMLRQCEQDDNNYSYGIDTVRDSGYEDTNLMDSYKLSGLSGAGGGGGGDYDSGVKVAPGNSGQTTYSWKEGGYSACSASCLGGVQDLIINCVSDDTGKTVIPLLCTAETKPESRVRTCNDHACPPRWNYSDFGACNSECGIGMQTRDVTCIHEVARGPGNTVVVSSHMCPTPAPVDRQHCNVWDCPPKWQPGEWSKCSKSCGNGVKRREVVCEQIMAQGHRQNVADRECQGPKPPADKPCNTRSCHENGNSNSHSIISSENSTYIQKDPENKVELKIGMTATVFQGITSIKIRCPVKKFHKAQITWTKDRAEIHKSKKYKINKKGTLRIIDIQFTDAGVYGCIAGQAHSETHLTVKHRTRDQMSSEEILRSGNNVQHRHDVNLDSGSPSSGENLQIDRAAPAYQGTFALGNDDLSHESRPEIQLSGKTTKKPRNKKLRPRPSPSSADSTSNGEYPVTSIHKSGYQESVESTAASSGSRLMPHFTQLITALKSYWPFTKNAHAQKRNHRTTPIKQHNPHRHKSSSDSYNFDKMDNNLKYNSADNDMGMFGHNTVIPDEKFGPDEERIFIDDDPYDLDTVVLSIDQLEALEHSKSIIENAKTTTATTQKSTEIEFEYSLKNIKTNDIHDNYLRSQRGTNIEDKINNTTITTTTTTATTEKLTDVIIEKSKNDTLIISTSTQSSNDENKLTTENKNTPTIPTTIIDELHINKKPTDQINENPKILSTTSTINLSKNDDDKIFDSGSEMEQIEDSYESELIKHKLNNNMTNNLNNKTLIINNMEKKNNENTKDSDLDGVDLGALEVVSNEDNSSEQKISSTTLSSSLATSPTITTITTTAKITNIDDKNEEKVKEILLNEKNQIESSTPLEILSFETNDSIDDESGDLNIFSTGIKDDMEFKWITTDWSKCSQPCGGGGFQMRGAQCTVRSIKSSKNTTQVPSRTVIGASLCEDAGFPMPQKVRPCGANTCPQWYAKEWTPCESSRCFTWKTAMQRREITCRIAEELANGTINMTIVDSKKCDDEIKPPQKQECHNDACKGVWRVGEWSKCTASCEDGIKYRILQCVWFGTKKPAGNVCRDLPRPVVMKPCKNGPCHTSGDQCTDDSPLCHKVNVMNLCSLYQRQCCKSCREAGHAA